MATDNAESALARLVGPHHARADDEARTLLREVCTSSADLEDVSRGLRVRLDPHAAPRRASPHTGRRRALPRAHSHRDRPPGDSLHPRLLGQRAGLTTRSCCHNAGRSGVAVTPVAAPGRAGPPPATDQPVVTSAVALYRRAISAEPKNGAAHPDLGVHLRSSGRGAAGTEEITQAVLPDPALASRVPAGTRNSPTRGRRSPTGSTTGGVRPSWSSGGCPRSGNGHRRGDRRQ